MICARRYQPSPATVADLSALSLCARSTVKRTYRTPWRCRRASRLRVARACRELGIRQPRFSK
jgi:hypothetical protein